MSLLCRSDPIPSTTRSIRTIRTLLAAGLLPVLALAAGCAGTSDPGGSDGMGGVLPVDPDRPDPVAVTEDLAESLLAYFSAPEEVLYITNGTKLLNNGAWTGIAWKSGDERARIPVMGDRRTVSVVERAAEQLVDRPAADGDVRWVNLARGRARSRGIAGTCRKRDGDRPVPAALAARDADATLSIRGVRLDGLTYYEVFRGDGREKVAERFAPIARRNYYTAKDCSSGYAGSAGVAFDWIVEQGLWPDP